MSRRDNRYAKTVAGKSKQTKPKKNYKMARRPTTLKKGQVLK